MLRRIITIDEEKCNGCGLCAEACHEGAIGIVGGKAKLLREDYCDGLGDCLPACPMNAISFEERDALAYDEAAVLKAKQQKEGGCPGCKTESVCQNTEAVSQLRQWPVQIKLCPITAPFFDGALVLVAADCTAYAYGDFHDRFMKNRVTLIGCPKLDGVNYAEKLSAIFAKNDIRSVIVTRMQVPCCGGMENAVRNAIGATGKNIPLQVVTISLEGEILNIR